MKTDTTPSGKISYSAARSGLEGYRAFDGKPNYSTDGTYSALGTAPQNGWLAYEFPTPKIVTKYVLYYGAMLPYLLSSKSPANLNGLAGLFTI